jgi:hypothetical protein
LAIPLTFARDFLLTEDQVLLIIDLDVIAGVFAEQDPVTHVYIGRDTRALFNLASSDGHGFALLRLFFGRIIMMPPFAVSFSSSLRTRTRSCRGVIFTVISLTSA